ncbi:ABC transporter substrate-binding protein [Endozoicomonas sp. SM1973]|uniref:ABC transporter substrate-binding protein n=1 Tax=Spartinivicinus marinus TaxID=2994442 RepID=A0A853HYX3_9GAMM|nr:ABC transporter substrate-binding protein [Spartinivicinus marinus]NYZ66393.1 ABC transporter substrate-binding protein [Spartinivicinus marinus]
MWVVSSNKKIAYTNASSSTAEGDKSVRNSCWICRLLLAVYVCLLATSVNAGPEDKVVLLTENYPPFNMSTNKKNFARGDNITGLSTEIVREMFKRANINYSLTLRFPWKRIFRLTLEKPNYGLFSTTRTPEREDLFKWVGPLVVNKWVFLAKPDSEIKLTKLDDAKQLRVGGYKGDALANYLESVGFQIITSFRDNENAVKLMSDKIDLWASGHLSGVYFASQEGIVGLKPLLTFKKTEMYLAFNKETPGRITRALQQALDNMIKDGTYDLLARRYL